MSLGWDACDWNHIWNFDGESGWGFEGSGFVCGGRGQPLCFDGGNYCDVDGNDEDCGEFGACDGACGTDEVDDPVLVSGAGCGFESCALYLFKFSFKYAGVILGEYKFGIVRDGGVEDDFAG